MGIENYLHGGDLIGEILKEQGVQFLFTLCGGHISPILTGAKKQGIRIIDVRSEANAVFAADATSRVSSSIGVAAVTAGPGITNTMTALQNAKLAQSPLILFGGAAPTLLQGKGALQDIDQMALIKPNVKWADTVKKVADIEPKLLKAFQIAQEGVPGPVFLELAIDILYQEDLIRDWHKKVTEDKRSLQKKMTAWYVKRHLDKQYAPYERISSDVFQPEIKNGTPSELARAADLIGQSENPVVIVGSGALMQSEKADELARAVLELGLPTYLSGMARGLIGRDNPIQFRHKRRLALKDADLVILAGVPCDFRLDYGSHIGSAKLISINRSKEDATKNRKPNLAIIADPTEVLIALSNKSVAKERSEWFSQLKKREEDREQEIHAKHEENVEGINPVDLFKHMEDHASEDAIFVADGGDFVGTSSYILKPRKPLSWLDPGVFGTLGVGGGFAMAAKLCNPQADVFIIFGDGSSAYSLMEVDTFQRMKIPVTVIIGNDGVWNQIARDQLEILKDDVGTVLEQSDYHLVAKAFGADGCRAETMGAFKQALLDADSANNKGKSFVINAILAKSDFRKGSISM